MVCFWHWHIHTYIISPPWWDFVILGMCWVTTTMMTMMFWLTGMSVGRLPRWSSEVQCSSPPLPVWAFHFKAVLKKTYLIMIFSVGLGPPSTSPSGFGLHLSLSIEAFELSLWSLPQILIFQRGFCEGNILHKMPRVDFLRSSSTSLLHF